MMACFELTMPNVGSWNGKWSGEGKRYFDVRKISKADLATIGESRSWYYNFGDGWGASIRMEIVESKEATKRRKQSAGFCGYEWMVRSILRLGKISAD